MKNVLAQPSALFLIGGNKRNWLVEAHYPFSTLIYMVASLRNRALVLKMLYLA